MFKSISRDGVTTTSEQDEGTSVIHHADEDAAIAYVSSVEADIAQPEPGPEV